ncbi:MAG: bifunctional ornithine acetyltransferase/N-acetylglutamate synthase [Brevinema sp.]
MVEVSHLEDGIIAPIGFKATGVSCGLKHGGSKDISLLLSQEPCTTAMAFTKNKIQGSHIAVDKERINGTCRALLINSGNANCLTGQQGVDDAQEIVRLTEEKLQLRTGECLLASTGVIGQPIDMLRIKYGIERLVTVIRTENNIKHFGSGIMTAENRQKNLAYGFVLDGIPVRIGVSAKGTTMIKPWLETMQGTLITIITSDICIEKKLLQDALADAIGISFNRMSIDNDLSPNDSVFFLANGMAKNPIISDKNDPRYIIFSEVLQQILIQTTKLLIRQGLGVTKLINLNIKNAVSAEQAENLVRKIAESYQVKTAFYGQLPAWQKILNVVSYSNTDFDLNSIEIKINNQVLFSNGVANIANYATARSHMAHVECLIEVDLKKGSYDTQLWTCDLSHDYVKSNSFLSE